ncbi:MAG: hypothetical protein E7358_06925 [Clostridiales bacterium]|nr:hypothetical protein [Clostridiales bacterium]
MSKKNSGIDAAIGGVLLMLILSSIIVPYILIVFGIVILILIIKKITKIVKAKKEENNFFNRDNCIQKIGGIQYLNKELTNKILFRQGVVSLTCDNEANNHVNKLLKKSFDSRVVNTDSYNTSVSATYKKSIVAYKINSDAYPIAFRFLFEKSREIVFYMFSDVILAFAENEKRTNFIGAYDLGLLKVDCQADYVRKTRVVYDKSKEEISNYYRYNPIVDAEIYSCDWTVKNLDGSRSFKGGLLPEHNPLIFILKFAKVQYTFGKLNMTVNFSNYCSAKDFVDEFIKI